jgi:glycosyltransferase involved in cell wall biosynthesis
MGGQSVLGRVLDNFEAQDAGTGSFEVLVVADASAPDPDAVRAAVGERPYETRVLQGATPGASANRNLGRHLATSPIVLFIDDDTLPEPQLVSEHLAWHRRFPADEVGVLGHVRWARELSVTPFMRWLEDGVQFDYPNIDGIEAGWGRFYTANVSLKRSFAERVGDFDEKRLPFGYEDLDLAYRASKLGMRLVYNRRAVVEHLRHMDLELWRKRVRRTAVAERQFVRLHPEIDPYFHRMFSAAAAARPARGRGVKLARFIPRWVPLLGTRVWDSVGAFYRQQLAPHFLAAWEADEAAPEERTVKPDLREREV